MIRLVHIASSGQLGGAERVILDILIGISASRPEWSLQLVVPLEGPLAQQARAAGVAVVVLPRSERLARLGDAMTTGLIGTLSRLGAALPAAIGDAFRLARVLRRIRPALIHTHGFKAHVLGMWARPWRIPIVLHLHDYIASRRLMSRILGVSPPGPMAAVAISRSVSEDARLIFGSRVKMKVVHNGIDAAKWSPLGPSLDLDGASGLTPPPPGTIRVGLVATMARWKGHETFLRAMALLPATLPVRAYVIGGPIYETQASQHSIEELRSLAASLGVGARVGFTGFVREPVHAIRALDIVVHASTRPEPFGRVIIEGMATARAVIARAHGGAAELFENGSEAVGCVTDDPAELAHAIERLARDAELRESLGARGRAHVQRAFSADRMSASIAQLYEELLGAR